VPQNPLIKPIVVSVADCARMLSVSRAQIYKLVENGDLPLLKIAGTRFAIPLTAIEEYVQNCPTGVGEFPKKKNVAPAPLADSLQSGSVPENNACAPAESASSVTL
jgi:excisionase family DNA binding protein